MPDLHRRSFIITTSDQNTLADLTSMAFSVIGDDRTSTRVRFVIIF
jgi:hypothetical protein